MKEYKQFRFSFRKKIMGIVASMLICLIAISGFSTYRLMQIYDEIVDVAEFTIPITNLVSLIRIHALEQELHLQRLSKSLKVQDIDEKYVRDEKRAFEHLGIKIDAEFQKAKQITVDGINNAKIKADKVFFNVIAKNLLRLDEEHRRFEEKSYLIQELYRDGDYKTAGEFSDTLIKEEDQFNKHLDELFHQLEKKTSESTQVAKIHEEQVVWLSILVTAFSVSVGSICSLFLIRRFSRPIEDLKSKIIQIDKGNLDVSVSATTADEIGTLNKNFNDMLGELRLKRDIENTFGKYLDPRIVQNIIDGEHIVDAKGIKREMTVMFAGVSGLSDLSHSVEPGHASSFYNEFLEMLSKPISDSKGVIDKFIGTDVMGFWGEPFTNKDEHPKLALAASMSLIASYPQIKDLLARHLGRHYDDRHHQLSIGVATGELIVGNMGSKNALSFTVMGDVVNNASRLKGACKQFGVAFLCSENSRNQSGGKYKFREIDTVIAKGMDDPLLLHEMIPETLEYSQYTEQNLDLYQQALNSYRVGDFEKAQTYWLSFSKVIPGDMAVKVMLDRLPELCAKKSSVWSGVWKLSAK